MSWEAWLTAKRRVEVVEGVFGSVERLASWVGICPGNNESAGKRKSGKIRKGNAWVRRLLCEFAQAAARTRCALKAKLALVQLKTTASPNRTCVAGSTTTQS